jgi:signal transduction histidine kinase
LHQSFESEHEDRVEQVKKKMSAGPSEAMAELASVFAAYNETTDRMHRSHQQLQREVHRLRDELQQKNEQLEQKKRLATLGEMAAGVAHEIRNPLGGIQLYASLLERDLTNQPEQQKWVQKINKAIRTLDMIVNDILTFTHDQVCEKRPTRLPELIHPVIEYLQPQLRDGAVTINLTGIDEGAVADVDGLMMERVLLNLLLNAAEAVGGSGTVFVRAWRCEQQGGVRIEIADTGPGIEPEILPKIFNPFFTTKDSGTGLGLAIVQRLVECHGGAIAASNGADGGAVFTILIPKGVEKGTGDGPNIGR